MGSSTADGSLERPGARGCRVCAGAWRGSEQIINVQGQAENKRQELQVAFMASMVDGDRILELRQF